MKDNKFMMCVLYKDNGERFKKMFFLKQCALDWFDTFKQTNKRPVTVIFYRGCVPYWVYHAEQQN